MSTPIKYFEKKLKSVWPTVTVQGSKKRPLYDWFCPNIIESTGSLNWKKWLPDLIDEEDIQVIQDTISSDSAFFLWKKASAQDPSLPNNMEITQIMQGSAEVDLIVDSLGNQAYQPILSNIETDDVLVRLVGSTEEGRAKIEEAERVYGLYDNNALCAVAIISSQESLKISFKNPGNAKKVLDKLSSGTVFLDVIYVSGENKSRGYGTRLMNRIENDYNGKVIVAHAVPRRGTLHFYKNRAFVFGNILSDSPDNYLEEITKYIDLATLAWHQGNPRLTLMHPETEYRMPKISFAHDKQWDEHTGTDIILFSGESNEYLLSEDWQSVLENTVNRYVGESRYVWMLPQGKTTKSHFTKVTEAMIDLSIGILRQYPSISEIVILCGNKRIKKEVLYDVAITKFRSVPKLNSPQGTEQSSFVASQPSASSGAYVPYEPSPSNNSVASMQSANTNNDDELYSYLFKKKDPEEYDLNKLRELVQYYTTQHGIMHQQLSSNRFQILYTQYGFEIEPDDNAKCIAYKDTSDGSIIGAVSFLHNHNRVRLLDIVVNKDSTHLDVFLLYLRITFARLDIVNELGDIDVLNMLELDFETHVKSAFPPYMMQQFINACLFLDQSMCKTTTAPKISSRKRSL